MGPMHYVIIMSTLSEYLLLLYDSNLHELLYIMLLFLNWPYRQSLNKIIPLRTLSLNSFGRRQLYQKAKPWMIQRRISIFPYQKKNGGCERKNYKKVERGVATLSRHILTKTFLWRDLTDDCLQFSVFSFSRSIFIWFLNIALSDCCFDFRLFFFSEVMDSFPWKIHLWVALMMLVHWRKGFKIPLK